MSKTRQTQGGIDAGIEGPPARPPGMVTRHQWVRVLRNAADRLRVQDANTAAIFDALAAALEEELGEAG